MHKNNKKIIVLIASLILLIMTMLAAGNIAYYSYLTSDSFIMAIKDLSRFRFHVGFGSEYLKNYRFAALFTLLVSLWMYVETEKYHHDAAGIEAGSASWNKNLNKYNKKYADPVGKKGNQGSLNMILSMHVRLSLEDFKTFRNNNIIIIGGAGTGKSRYLVKPNLLQMNSSYVVTDPSGELLRSMKKIMQENGYEVKVFNLVNMFYSNTYNPFHYIRDDAGIGILVECFITNTTAPDEAASDPFWKNSEKALLTACIYYLRDFCDEKDQNFSRVLFMIQLAQIDENSKTKVQTPLDMLFNGNGIIKDRRFIELKDRTEIEIRQKKLSDSLAWKNYQTFRLGGEKTLKSILISTAVRLNPFNVPAVANLTSSDNIALDTIGNKKTVLFVIIPQAERSYNFLASMMFSQLFSSLYYHAEHSGGRLNEHVRFIMDEFANTGKIPQFPELISTMRKYNISANVILQSIAQIKEMYKDNYETIFGNCDTSILLGTQEQTTAEYFTKQLGKTTIRSKSSGLSNGKRSGSSMNFQQTGRELMTMDEIRSMSNEKCLVFIRGEKPFFDEKYDLTKHPKYEDTGDAKKERRYEITEDVQFLNYSSPELERVFLEEEEPKEATEMVQKAQKIDSLEIKKKDTLGEPLIRITDIDKQMTLNCLMRTKKILDDALAKLHKTHKKACGLCVIEYGLDQTMLPVLVRKAFYQYQKSVLIFTDTEDPGELIGYFCDKEDLIHGILEKYHLSIAVMDPVNREENDTLIYRAIGLKVEQSGDIQTELINGFQLKSDDLLKEFEDMIN